MRNSTKHINTTTKSTTVACFTAARWLLVQLLELKHEMIRYVMTGCCNLQCK